MSAPSSGPRARTAGVFYLITFVTGSVAFFARGPVGVAAGVVAGVSYVAVTLLFYGLFKPAGRGLSLLAAIVGLVGCAIGPLGQLHVIPFQINPLVFFGFYCLMIGTLILRSTFLPRVLGALMMFAALGWLTFLAPSFAKQLSPYNILPGFIGEGVLTVWLLVKGVDVERWRRQESGGAGTMSA